MGDVKQVVNRKISENKVMVFSKSYCPDSTMVKKVFEMYVFDGTLKKEDFECWDIETSPQCSAIEDYFKDLTGLRSVPSVFINGKYFGGSKQTAAAHKDGTLKKLLQ
ncbi:electron transport chain [Mactra antiquata]